MPDLLHDRHKYQLRIIIVSFFVTSIIILLSLWQMGKLDFFVEEFRKIVHIKSTQSITVINSNPSLYFEVYNEKKAELIKQEFADFFEKAKISKIIVEFTDNPDQTFTKEWNNNEKFSGFSSKVDGDTVYATIFLDAKAIKRAGWIERNVAGTAELSLIEALNQAKTEVFPMVISEPNPLLYSEKISSLSIETFTKINHNGPGYLFLAQYK